MKNWLVVANSARARVGSAAYQRNPRAATTRRRDGLSAAHSASRSIMGGRRWAPGWSTSIRSLHGDLNWTSATCWRTAQAGLDARWPPHPIGRQRAGAKGVV